MFGFNVGVSMTYMKVVSLLQRGVRVFASRTTRCIDVLPFEEDDEETAYAGTDTESAAAIASAITEVPAIEVPAIEVPVDEKTEAVLRAADEYLAKADAVKTASPKTVAIAPTPNYDFASLYGLQATATPELETEIIKPVASTPVAQPALTQPAQPSPAQSAPAPTPEIMKAPVVQSRPVEHPMQQTIPKAPVQPAPDLSGMTLKGQAQAIGKWATSTVMSESVLFDAFGKSVILKLVSEGYLVRTKKGIMLGS